MAYAVNMALWGPTLPWLFMRHMCVHVCLSVRVRRVGTQRPADVYYMEKHLFSAEHPEYQMFYCKEAIFF